MRFAHTREMDRLFDEKPLKASRTRSVLRPACDGRTLIAVLCHLLV